jgi:hypothetical protein
VSTVPTEPIQAKPTPPAAIEEAPTLPPVVVSTAPTVPTPAKPAPALSPVVVPTQVEIKDRLLKFYAFVGVGANGKYNNRNIFKFIDRANKVDDGLKMVAESLAKDFVDSVQAADLLEKQILHDYKHEPSGYPPFEFVFRYTQNPSKKQFTDREIGADSAAWQTVQHQSNTFSQPEKELFEQLQKEYFSYKGGLQLDLKNGRKLKQ